MFAKFSRFWKDGKGTHAPNVPMDVCSCPANCGLCSNHLSHTGLSNIIITNRCDLTCWYCFFYVKKGLEGAYVYEPTMDQIREMARTLKSERPVPGNSVQITGGEPTIRDDLPEIIRIMQGGRRRPHTAQHERHQPRARARPGEAAERRRRVEPLHVLRRHVPEDQPEEPLGDALRARGLQEGRHRRRARPHGHQDDQRP